MIDTKIQEVFDYFIKEALWRDTIIKDVRWYYAESELYVFRFPAGYHYGFCFIHAKSPEDAGKYFFDKFWMEHNFRPTEDALKAKIAELEKQLSDSADEGYVGFMLGIEQMKKKLAEKDKEIERLKAALSDISKIGFEGKIGDKVARETARRIANSALAPDTNVGTMEDGK